MFALLSRNRYLFPLTNFWIFYKIVKILKDIASSDLLYLLIIVQSPSYIYRLKNVLVLWTFLMRFQDSMVFLFFCFFFWGGRRTYYCVKSVRIRICSGPYFYRIWTEHGEILRIWTLLRSAYVWFCGHVIVVWSVK